MAFKVKVYKNSSFMDKRGYYWTSWKKDLIKLLIVAESILNILWYSFTKTLKYRKF